MDLQDLNDLREARRALDLMGRPGVSTASRFSLRHDAMNRIDRILNRNPEVKDPVGGNVDVTTKDKGQIIDTKI